MVVAAKAAGLHAIDNVYLRLWRKEDSPTKVAELQRGLREKNVGAANLGMDGTWVIHPQQAEIANACYTPSAEQVEDARRVVTLYHEKGGGSMADPKSGEMIDEATIKIALNGPGQGRAGRNRQRKRAQGMVREEPLDHRLRHPGVHAPRGVAPRTDLSLNTRPAILPRRIRRVRLRCGTDGGLLSFSAHSCQLSLKQPAAQYRRSSHAV